MRECISNELYEGFEWIGIDASFALSVDDFYAPKNVRSQLFFKPGRHFSDPSVDDQLVYDGVGQFTACDAQKLYISVRDEVSRAQSEDELPKNPGIP